MDRINWFFEQSVGFEDMNFLDDATEDAIEKRWREGEHPFGIVSGYVVAPGAGLDIVVTGGGGDSVAYDRQGRRIQPTTNSITQSVALTTLGASTAVVGAANERYISVFARAGRRFTTSDQDGNELTVRKYMLDALNSLGDGSHPPGGAYNPVTALEAGIDQFHVVVGVEDTVGRALRPGLLDDGVLICDLRLTFGATGFSTREVFQDRRQNYLGPVRNTDYGFRDLYAGAIAEGETAPKPLAGLTIPPRIVGQNNMSFRVSACQGYLYDASLGYRRFRTPDYTYVKTAPSHASQNRQDLVVIEQDGGLRAIQGTPATGEPIPPAVPTGAIPLFEARIHAGTTQAGGDIVPRAFRRLPYPASTQTGILEGCRLAWDWPSTSGTSTLYVASPSNKLVFHGEVVEFRGGYFEEIAPHLPALQDSYANPFATTIGVGGGLRSYFVYACRNQFVENVDTGFFNHVSIIESTAPPDPSTGQASTTLGGSRGSIFPEDTLLIGVGWAWLGGRMPVVATDDGWFTPEVTATISRSTAGTVGSVITLNGVPGTSLVDRVRLFVTATGSSSSAGTLTLAPADNPNGGFWNSRVYAQPAVTGQQTHGEAVLPVSFGNIWAQAAGGATWSFHPVAYHVTLPRMQHGLHWSGWF